MFIVFEGMDGSGKSSLIQALSQKLKEQKIVVTLTREPGGTPLAEKIRALLLDVSQDAPVDRVELLLYEASRAQHVEKKIRPALQQKQWVLCDRFTASSVAFQHYARGVPREPVDWLNNFAIGGVEPDMTILLDLPFAEAEKRMNRRGETQGKDRMEQEAKEFHEKVRQGYLQEAKGQAKWLVLDAMQTTEQMAELVLQNWKAKGWLKS